MYVFELPPDILASLSLVLDVNSEWVKLADILRFTVTDKLNIEREMKSGKSPTECLLYCWGTRGHTVDQLFKGLYKIDSPRAMQILKPLLVDGCLFNLLSNKLIVKKHAVEPVVEPKADDQKHCVVSPVDVSAAAMSPSDVSPRISTLMNCSYNELSIATDGFSPKLIIGRGGYGTVYKANWQYMTVAVKRLDISNQSFVEDAQKSLSELEILHQYRHDHILPLYGFWFDKTDSERPPCFIYQFMANGSLEDRIRMKDKTVSLTWPIRKSITFGIASGIHFLHQNKRWPPVIHGDIKSANILLDSHWIPKLGDFGLAHHGAIDVCEQADYIMASHIKGTWAYLPPEYISQRKLGTFLDVFSFGVVLFELATGLKSYSEAFDTKSRCLYKLMHNKLNPMLQLSEPVVMLDLADKHTDPPTDQAFVLKLFHLGLLCTNLNCQLRPKMSQVLEELNVE